MIGRDSNSIISEFTIFNCPNLKELSIFGSQLTNLDLTEFPNLEILNLSSNLSLANLNIQDNQKLKKLSVYRSKLRSLDVSHLTKLQELDICGKEFLDIQSRYSEFKELKLGKLKKLTKLDCCSNQLTNLYVGDCPNLKELNCCDNFLTSLDLSQNSKLEELNISDNNFTEKDLSFLNHLVSLKKLELGNKQSQSVYNHFHGSLETLKNMNRLEKLDISNTDLNSGVEYLPNSLSGADWL